MFCKHCGKEIDDNSTFCPSCGGKQVIEAKGSSLGETGDKINKAVENKDAWYYEWWFIILMIFVFFPVGIVLLILKLANK